MIIDFIYTLQKQRTVLRPLKVSKVLAHYHFLGCFEHCCCVSEVMKKVFVAKLEIVLLVLRTWARTGLAIFVRSFRCISIVAFCAKFTLGSSSIIFAVLTRQKEMISQVQASPCYDAFLLQTNNAGSTTQGQITFTFFLHKLLHLTHTMFENHQKYPV